MFSITDLIIACLIYHSVRGLPDIQIVGGTDALDGQYPYQVSLKRTSNKRHFCGGAIISKRYVVTAAHCLDGLYYPSEVLIDVGSNYLSRFQTTYTAAAIIPHPNYNKTLHIDDIGLIKLEKDIKFNNNTKLIDLISQDHDFEGVALTVTGWGRLSWEGQVPERLQYITITGFNQSKCVQIYSIISINITNHHICTLEAVNQGMCNGDSGGALTYKGELAGIVSFGMLPCASGNPDVFTRVFHYRSWINGHVNAGNNQHLNILLGLFTIYLCIHSFL